MDIRAPFAILHDLWKPPKNSKPDIRAQLDDAAVTSLLIALGIIALAWLFWRNARARLGSLPKRRKQSVAILVLGDVGRSPRMMYHAESFAKHGFETVIVGYEGTTPIAALLKEPLVRFCYLPTPPIRLRQLPFILIAPVKVAHQIYSIVETLLVGIPNPPEFIIIQNPPSIPTLAIVWLAAKLRGCKVIIDWHNLGYTILALRVGQNHPLVWVAKKFEAYFGQSAYAHLFVTQAMRDHLVKQWGLKGQKAVLHDRPPAHFSRTPAIQKHDFFCRHYPTLIAKPALKNFFLESNPRYSTPFTHIPHGVPAGVQIGRESANSPPLAYTNNFGAGAPLQPPSVLSPPTPRPGRPALLVSSTSWTPDEDFGLLLEALKLYEAAARRKDRDVLEGVPGAISLPKVLMIVTGKGPLRDKYMCEIDELQIGTAKDGKQDGWRWVRCISMWLEAEDYPVLLGSADLGICLHSSSSNLDLPMKVVDMFGCGLPVCALSFDCLPELVKDGKNGLIFKDAVQLAAQLEDLLASFPDSATLSALSSSLNRQHHGSASSHSYHGLNHDEGPDFEWSNWTENWDRVVWPLLSESVERIGS